MKEKKHISAVVGILLSLLCLTAFGADNFVIPAMLAIFVSLTLLQGRLKGGTMA